MPLSSENTTLVYRLGLQLSLIFFVYSVKICFAKGLSEMLGLELFQTVQTLVRCAGTPAFFFFLSLFID